MKKKNILIVAAHPDDEVLGCGGAIANHVLSEDNVFLLILADGVTSRIYDPSVPRSLEMSISKLELATRKQELFQAAELLGVKPNNISVHLLPDQRLDSLPLLDVIKIIEGTSKEINPDIIYTHHWSDLNKDHRVVHEAVITSFRPSRTGAKKVQIRSFEIPGNMGVLSPIAINVFDPNIFIDITDHLDVKIRALKAYQSEQSASPRPTSPENVVQLAKMRGRQANCKYAEGFEEIII